MFLRSSPLLAFLCVQFFFTTDNGRFSFASLGWHPPGTVTVIPGTTASVDQPVVLEATPSIFQSVPGNTPIVYQVVPRTTNGGHQRVPGTHRAVVLPRPRGSFKQSGTDRAMKVIYFLRLTYKIQECKTDEIKICTVSYKDIFW